MMEECRSSSSLRRGLWGNLSFRFNRSSFVLQSLLLVLTLSIITACGLKSESRGIPAEVDALITSVTADIAAERYEKIYNEAADLWKQELDLDETVAVFKTLNAKLGKMENRTLHSATEQHNSGGPLKGNVFILSYQTRFEKGEGMETFTVVQRDNQWQLARYFVNSTALK
ncbi:MAG TPA: DUF4019 domain-containing protein [Pyrinomonadaceae bacterium]|nr:DUF4019 domain-containing protein [Pyrinomonadaceae bacterium]